MDTSRSNESAPGGSVPGADAAGGWTAEALVFSGRRDPVWPVTATAAAELVACWDGLPPVPAAEVPAAEVPAAEVPAAGGTGRGAAELAAAASAAPAAPVLGYRGCVLRAPDGREWRVAGGTVTAPAGEDAEMRADPGRRFERLVLASAPPGTLPPIRLV
jgi:hypothetical protein